jgi:hypothetical protein
MEASSIQGVTKAIGRTTGLFQNTSLLVHKGTVRPQNHHIPCVELGSSRAKLPNSREGQVHVRACMAFRGGLVKSTSLLTPHERNVGPTGRTVQGRRSKDGHSVALFKVVNNTQLCLICPMGSKIPVVSHIHKAHPFQGKQLSVVGISQFATDNSADCTSFANKSSPAGHVWDTEFSLVLAAKGGPTAMQVA